MSNNEAGRSRRDFLKKSLIGLAAVPFAGALFHQKTRSRRRGSAEARPKQPDGEEFRLRERRNRVEERKAQGRPVLR